MGFKSIYSVGTVTSIKFFEITEPFMTDVNYKAGPVGLVIDILKVQNSELVILILKVLV